MTASQLIQSIPRLNFDESFDFSIVSVHMVDFKNDEVTLKPWRMVHVAHGELAVCKFEALTRLQSGKGTLGTSLVIPWDDDSKRCIR